MPWKLLALLLVTNSGRHVNGAHIMMHGQSKFCINDVKQTCLQCWEEAGFYERWLLVIEPRGHIPASSASKVKAHKVTPSHLPTILVHFC